MNSRPKEELERNVGDENGREKERARPSPRPGERDDPGGSKKTRRQGAKREKRQGNATEVNTAVRAATQRTEDHSGGFGGANKRHAQRRGPSEGQPGKR